MSIDTRTPVYSLGKTVPVWDLAEESMVPMKIGNAVNFDLVYDLYISRPSLAYLCKALGTEEPSFEEFLSLIDEEYPLSFHQGEWFVSLVKVLEWFGY